jgi:hypothetical protein
VNRRAKGQALPPLDPAEILIAAYPSTTMENELQLVKAALLYGDRVRLVSPGAQYLAAVNAFTSSGPMEMALILDENGVLNLDRSVRATFEECLRPTRINKKDLQKAGQLKRQLQHFAEDGLKDAMSTVGELFDSFQMTELLPAIQRGLVTIEEPRGFSHRDALNQILTNQLDIDMDRYMGQLVELVSSSTTHTMIDTKLSEVVGPLTSILDHLGFETNERTRSSATSASTAAALMSRLPIFPGATIDEVLELRDDIAPYTIEFRKTVDDASFQIDVLDEDFGNQVAELWRTKVAPAVQELRNEVNTSDRLKYLRPATGHGLVIAAIGSAVNLAGLGPVATIGVVVAGAALSARAQQIEFVAQMQKRPFWYLYEIERQLTDT